MRSTMLSAILTTVLCACVGTADSVHEVHGFAPANQACRVAILEAGTSHVRHSQDVRGEFTMFYTVGGFGSPTVDINATCNGKLVRELKAVRPRATGVADLGTLAP